MTKKMLQFVDLKQETPEKRNTDKRKGDFNEIYKEFIERSTYWKNVYDKSIGFMRPKLSDGNFKKEFDSETETGRIHSSWH